MKLLLPTIALVFSFSAWADFTGNVIGVADGDTLTILDTHMVQRKIRLAEIDSPEKRQPFGNKSKQALSALVYGKAVLVVEQGHDKYKRTIGRVYYGNVDVNAEQVRHGMAWVYRKYAPTDSPLYAIENEARVADA